MDISWTDRNVSAGRKRYRGFPPVKVSGVGDGPYGAHASLRYGGRESPRLPTRPTPRFARGKRHVTYGTEPPPSVPKTKTFEEI